MPSGVRIASGLTPKQEMYCQLLARGQNLSAAYREAYNSLGSSKTVNDSASKLWARPEIRQRVEALCQEQSQRMIRDSVAIRRHVFSHLLAESQNMASKASERISALVALGKIDIVGMFREVRAVERLSDRPPAEIEAELRSKMAQFLGEAAGSKRSGATSRSDGVSTEIERGSLL